MQTETTRPVCTLGALRNAIEQFKTKVKFLELVAYTFGVDSQAYAQIAKAEEMVDKGFDHIKRHSGEQYIEHLRGVAVIGLVWGNERDAKSVISDLHHDSVEDIDMTLSLLRREFGKRVELTVAGQTKPDLPDKGALTEQAYNELCSQIIFEHVKEAGKHSMRGKCRDRLHNMITLWGTPEEKLAKINETLQFMLPIAIHIDYLWQELTIATAEQLQRLSVDDTKKANLDGAL